MADAQGKTREAVERTSSAYNDYQKCLVEVEKAKANLMRATSDKEKALKAYAQAVTEASAAEIRAELDARDAAESGTQAAKQKADASRAYADEKQAIVAQLKSAADEAIAVEEREVQAVKDAQIAKQEANAVHKELVNEKRLAYAEQGRMAREFADADKERFLVCRVVAKALTHQERQHYDDGMEILDSARKHDVFDADILHALDNVIRYREQEYDGEVRIFAIGPDRAGRFLELVLVPASSPARVIHADLLQPNHYHYL